MKRFDQHAALVLSLVALCTGCAVPDNRPSVQEAMREEVRRFDTEARREPIIKTNPKPYVKARPVEYREPREEISIAIQGGSVRAAIESVAKPKGYTVVIAKGLKTEAVNIELVNLDFEHAVREIASAVGAAAVFNHARKAIYVAPEATYTFRIPQHLFDDLAMSYSVSSNPALGGQGGATPNMGGVGSIGHGAPASGLGAAGGTPGANHTNMKVSGGAGSALESFTAAIKQIAGDKAKLSVMRELGLLSVRADGSALKRVTQFLETFTRDAGRQIEVKAALVEITLGNELAYGIDWSKILSNSARTIEVGLATTSVVPRAVVNATITTNSIRSVIKALEGATAVKVVAEPQLWMLNHQPGIVFNATQRPYLGAVTTSIAGNASISSTAGALSYAMDGVSLAFRPHILDNSRAELTVIPMLSTAVNQQTFKPGNGLELTGYDLPTTSSHMKLLLESGKTYIVGGSRFTSQNFQQVGVPGVRQAGILGQLLSGTDDLKTAKELVLLLHTNVLPAPELNVIVGESL